VLTLSFALFAFVFCFAVFRFCFYYWCGIWYFVSCIFIPFYQYGTS
jgi:hypothetical protein